MALLAQCMLVMSNDSMVSNSDITIITGLTRVAAAAVKVALAVLVSVGIEVR
jgi:hypothetical protein